MTVIVTHLEASASQVAQKSGFVLLSRRLKVTRYTRKKMRDI